MKVGVQSDPRTISTSNRNPSRPRWLRTGIASLPSPDLSHRETPTKTRCLVRRLRFVVILRGIFKTQHYLHSLVILDNLGMSRGEVPGVLEQGPVTADDVDDEEDDFVRHVVEEQAFPGDGFLLQA